MDTEAVVSLVEALEQRCLCEKRGYLAGQGSRETTCRADPLNRSWREIFDGDPYQKRPIKERRPYRRSPKFVGAKANGASKTSPTGS